MALASNNQRRKSLAATNSKIFSRIGVREEDGGKAGTKYAVYWPDGTYRWVFSVRRGRPGFVAFVRGKAFRVFLTGVLIYLMVVFRQFFPTRVARIECDVVEGGLLAKALVAVGANDWDMFGGSPGIKRNIVASLLRNREVVRYLKVPLERRGDPIEFIDELEVYNYLEELSLEHTVLPECEEIDGALVTTPLIGRGYSDGDESVLTSSLAEIANKSVSEVRLATYKTSINLHDRLEELRDKSPEDPNFDITKLEKIRDNLLRRSMWLDDARVIQVSFSLVDFTEWNSFVAAGKVGLIDVEFAARNISLGYDLVHFFCQNWIMSENNHNIDTFRRLLSNRVLPLFMRTFKCESTETSLYIDLYTIQNALRVLELYVQQSELHHKGFAQIDLWQHIDKLWMTRL